MCITHFLRFVTRLIAWIHLIQISRNIVRIKMRAVEKAATIKEITSSVLEVKPAYQKVNSFFISKYNTQEIIEEIKSFQ